MSEVKDEKRREVDPKDVDESSDESDDEVQQHQYKVIVLGDGAVGKTSVIMRFCEDQFDKKYKQTIGLDFFIKRIVLPGDVHVALQVWDIGGQTIGSKMIGSYLYGSHAVIFAYDVTNYQSFQDVEDWLQLVKDNIDPASLPILALVGNKTDLAHLRAVKKEKHEAFAAENQMQSYFVSAKTGDNVKPVFYRTAADLAHVVLSKNEIDASTQVVKAEIINYPQHDPAQPPLVVKEKKSKCIVQ